MKCLEEYMTGCTPSELDSIWSLDMYFRYIDPFKGTFVKFPKELDSDQIKQKTILGTIFLCKTGN